MCSAFDGREKLLRVVDKLQGKLGPAFILIQIYFVLHGRLHLSLWFA
jgi:hypothetical protein